MTKKQKRIVLTVFSGVASGTVLATTLGLCLSSNYKAPKIIKNNSLQTTRSENFLSNSDISSDFRNKGKTFKQFILNNDAFSQQSYVPQAKDEFVLNAQLKYRQQESTCQWFSTNLTSSRVFNSAGFVNPHFNQLKFEKPNQTSPEAKIQELTNIAINWANSFFDTMYPDIWRDDTVALPSPKKNAGACNLGAHPIFDSKRATIISKSKKIITKNPNWRPGGSTGGHPNAGHGGSGGPQYFERWEDITPTTYDNFLFDSNPTTFGYEVDTKYSATSGLITTWNHAAINGFQKGNIYISPSWAWYTHPNFLKPDFSNTFNSISKTWKTYEISNPKFSLESFKTSFPSTLKWTSNAGNYTPQGGGHTNAQFLLYDDSFNQQASYDAYYSGVKQPTAKTVGTDTKYWEENPIGSVLNYGTSATGIYGSRFDNTYLDLTDLITLDTGSGGTSSINNGDSVWGINGQNPQVKFGWNGELMWALKQKTLIAAKVNELIKGISPKTSSDPQLGVFLSAWKASQHTRDSVAILLEDVYNERIDYQTLANEVEELRNGRMDYFYHNQGYKKVSPEAKILTKYGWNLINSTSNGDGAISRIRYLNNGFDSTQASNSELTDYLNEILSWQLPYEYITPQIFSNDIYADATFTVDGQDQRMVKIYDGGSKSWLPVSLYSIHNSNGVDNLNNDATIQFSNIRFVRAGSGVNQDVFASPSSSKNNTLSLKNIFNSTFKLPKNQRIATSYNSSTRTSQNIVAYLDDSSSRISDNSQNVNETLTFHFQYNPDLNYETQMKPSGAEKSLTVFTDNLYVSDYLQDMANNGGRLSEKYQNEIYNALHVPTKYSPGKDSYINLPTSYSGLNVLPETVNQEKYEKYYQLSNDLVYAQSKIDATAGNPTEDQKREYLQTWKALNDLKYFYALLYTQKNQFPIDFYTKPEEYNKLVSDGSIIPLSEDAKNKIYSYGVQIESNAATLDVGKMFEYLKVGIPDQAMKNDQELNNGQKTLSSLKTQYSNLSDRINESFSRLQNIKSRFVKMQSEINSVVNGLKSSFVDANTKKNVVKKIKEILDNFVLGLETDRSFLDNVLVDLEGVKTKLNNLISNVEANVNADYEATFSIQINPQKIFADSHLLKSKTLKGFDDPKNENQLAYYFGLTYEQFSQILQDEISKNYPGLDLKLNKKAFKLDSYSLDGVVGSTQNTPWVEYYNDGNKTISSSWTLTQKPTNSLERGVNELSSITLNFKVNEKINVLNRGFDFLQHKNQLIENYKNKYQTLRSDALSFEKTLTDRLSDLKTKVVEIEHGLIVDDKNTYNNYLQVLKDFENAANKTETLKVSRWKTLNNLGYYYIPVEVKSKNNTTYNFGLKITNNFRVLDINDLGSYFDSSALTIKQKVVEQDKINLLANDAERYYNNLSAVQKQLTVLRKTVDRVGNDYFKQLQESINSRITQLLKQHPELQAKVDVVNEQYDPEINKIISELEKGFDNWNKTNEYKGSGFVQKMDMKFDFSNEIENLKTILNKKMSELQSVLNSDPNVVSLKTEFDADIFNFNNYITKLLKDVSQLKEDMEVLKQDVESLILNLKSINNFEYNCSTTIKFNINKVMSDSKAYWIDKKFNFMSLENLNYLFGVSKLEFINKINEIVKTKTNFDIKLNETLFLDQTNGVEVVKRHYSYLKKYELNPNNEVTSLSLTIKYFDHTKVSDVVVSPKTSDVTPNSLRIAAKQKILNSIEKCEQILNNINGTIVYISDVLKQGEKNKNIANQLKQNFHPELQKIQSMLDSIQTTNQKYSNGFIIKQAERLNPTIMAITIISGLASLGLIAGLGIYFGTAKKRRTKQISESEKLELDKFISEDSDSDILKITNEDPSDKGE